MAYLKRKIVTTEDGSHTLSIPALDEHYHSTHGAIQESKHVFLKTGIEIFSNKTEIAILEVGFGTGLNALLTLDWAIRNNCNVRYTSLEKYPLISDEYEILNYGDLMVPPLSQELIAMHTKDWEMPLHINPYFTLTKLNADLLTHEDNATYDGVYFDAFAPDVQPDLWTPSIFEKMYECLNKGGFLVTYCAKGQVRRNMISAGFIVERLPGPPGKREMLRALKV